MKASVIILALYITSSLAFAGGDEKHRCLTESQVPKSVLEAAKKAFPKVSDRHWEQTGSKYSADVEIKGQRTRLWLDEKGKVLKKEKLGDFDINKRKKA